MPENRSEQQVLDFRIVEAPESFRITRDPCYGRSWLYGEKAADPQKSLRILTEFKILRRAASGMADPAKASTNPSGSSAVKYPPLANRQSSHWAAAQNCRCPSG